MRTPDGLVLTSGRSIGIRRLHVFGAVRTGALIVDLGGSGATLTGAAGFRTGHERLPRLPSDYRALTTIPD